MKSFPLSFVGWALSSSALAQEEEERSLATSLELVAGLPSGILPINAVSSVAADLHGTIGLTTDGAPFGDLGTNLGVSMGHWEFKPLGFHVHGHSGEALEMAYSLEARGALSADWALGFGLGVGEEGMSEIHSALSWRGFTLNPAIHREEESWHSALGITALWRINSQFSVGPRCQFSEELVHCGGSLQLAHNH